MKRLAFLRAMYTANPQDQGTDPERPAPVPNAVQPPNAIIPTGTAPGEFILSIAEGPRRTKESRPRHHPNHDARTTLSCERTPPSC